MSLIYFFFAYNFSIHPHLPHLYPSKTSLYFFLFAFSSFSRLLTRSALSLALPDSTRLCHALLRRPFPRPQHGGDVREQGHHPGPDASAQDGPLLPALRRRGPRVLPTLRGVDGARLRLPQYRLHFLRGAQGLSQGRRQLSPATVGAGAVSKQCDSLSVNQLWLYSCRCFFAAEPHYHCLLLYVRDASGLGPGGGGRGRGRDCETVRP